jgi:hypothetical protein
VQLAITRPENVVCLAECDLETSTMTKPRLARNCRAVVIGTLPKRPDGLWSQRLTVGTCRAHEVNLRSDQQI